MNRVHIFYLFSILWFVVSPALTAPADQQQENGSPEIPEPNQSDNEIENVNVNKDVESFTPNNPSESDETPEVEPEDQPSFSGGSSGIITRRFCDDEPLECRNYTCPIGTVKCIFNSTYASDGKTAETQYKCFLSNGTLTTDVTKIEEIPQPVFGFINIDFVHDFTQSINSFLDVLRSFRN